MGLLKILLVFVLNSDSVAVSVFEAKGVTEDVAYSLSTAIRGELGKELGVLSSKDLEAKGLLGAPTFDKAMEICRTQNIPILIGGEVKKVRDKYRIQAICLHRMRRDTIVTVTSSPISVVSLLANSLIKLVTGEKETHFGSIVIATDPDGAEILLDGEYIGVTPEKVDLVPFGEHSVLFSKRGYATAVKLIVVYPGKITDISSSLVPVTGSLIAPADKAPVYFIEEIVVRGEKIREELFRVPKGIDILTARDIEYSGAKDIPELLSQVPGVSVRDKTGSGVATSVSIRGMDPSKYTIVTLDGIVINRLDGEVNWGAIPMDIVKRIEVIKGAASAPYGGEAMGGVINIVTKERQKNKVSLSSTNARDGGWAATLSATDGWDIWVNTYGRKGQGWREEEDYDIRTFYGKFSFPIYEKDMMIFSLDATKQKNLFPGGLDSMQLEENRAQPGEDKEEKLWENVRLTSQYETKTPESKFSFKFHTMPQGYKATGIRKWELNGIDIGASSEYKRENFSFLTEVGGSNLRRKIHPTPSDTSRSDDNSQSIELRSLLEWEERLLNIVILTPGVKYELIAYRLEDYTKLPHSTKKISVASLSPKFGLIWSSMRFDAFSSLERTIRPPKPYEKVKNIELKPEVLTAIELGCRARRYPFTGSASVFYIAIEDPILIKGITFENYQDCFHRGVESEINWTLSRNFSFFLGHTSLEARFRETNSWVPQVPTSETTIGAKISYIPVYSLTATYNFYGKSYLDFENRFAPLNPYEALDITLKFKPTPSFSLIFAVTNFTNEEGTNFGYELYEKARYYPIAPRGFRIEAGLEF